MGKNVNKNLSKLLGVKIAHRGLWNSDNPENSIGAYKRCIDRNIPIELDVHILKDDTLVVMHDDNTYRMTGEKIVLKNAIYADIKNLRLKDTDYKIPKFSEILDFVGGKVLLDIELKYDVKNFKICREVCKYLDGYDGDFIVKSFNPIYLLWFRLFKPDYIRGLLVSGTNKKNNRKVINYVWFSFLTFFNLFMKSDFIAFEHRDLPNKKIEKLRKSGVPILLFTLKERDIINYKYDGYIYEG